MQDEIVVKNKKWEFDENVTQVFDNMLERSIPSYKEMRNLTQKLGFKFVRDGTSVIDIGCSNGNAIAPFIEKFGNEFHYKLYDVSEPMLNKCQQRFKQYKSCVTIKNFDITQGIKGHASVVLSILTLQFTPIEYRQKIVQSVYDSLIPGGAFFLVEKILGSDNNIDTLLVDEYYAMKADNQYTEVQIKTKRKSLEGVLVPITAKWNEDLLHSVGFKHIDCYWRSLNFAGWVAIK